MIPNREVISIDTIQGIEIFRNVKFQAPNSNEIRPFRIQAKYKNTSTKNSNKFQMTISNDPNRFVIWNFGHCDLIVICYLRFGNFHRNVTVSSSFKLEAVASGRAEPHRDQPPMNDRFGKKTGLRCPNSYLGIRALPGEPIRF
ncbi:MAG: hypothetical protein WBN68_22305 [Sedimenticolaceae bacterium]